MRIAAILLAFLVPGVSAQTPPSQPMAADANPVFAVATIRPSDPYSDGKGTFIKGRHYATLNTTLSYLIQYAYGFHARQIVAGPEWLDKDKYDIAAVPDGEGQPSDDQWKIMVQKLLTDRFALTFHRDIRDLSVYLLIVGKGGSKLAKSDGDPSSTADLTFGRIGGVIRLPARNATIDDFTHVMQRNMVDRPIVDRTGLTGRFNFTLTFTPNEYQIAMVGGGLPPPGVNPPPELFTAIEQQLGLKLEPAKAPAKVLVIDHVERPSAN
jgi:uncharacterized protein (TIGR03435 family)